MKRIILACVAMTFAVTAGAQVKLGYSLHDVKTFIKKAGYKPDQEGFDAYGHNYVAVFEDRIFYRYQFDANDNCIAVVLIPTDQGALNALAEYYNKNYVVISSAKWKAYTNNGVADIDMTYSDGKCGFVWQKEN